MFEIKTKIMSKTAKNYETFTSSKKVFCVFMYKMDAFPLFTAKAWRKNGVEAIKHGSEILINQGIFEKKFGLKNISDKTQYYSDEFKKMRCKIKDCDKYQSCRMFMENTTAVKITMASVKTKAALFKSKFGVKQHDKILRKQQSLCLRLKKIFLNTELILLLKNTF